jgi:succinate dehydrogenase / fumarate reductase, cytochrome b subunit
MAMGFISSTVGRKILMAITGLMLVTFLCIHLLGNSFIYLGWINAYGERLHSMPPLVWLARIGMVVLLAVHIFFGIKITLENNAARPQVYAVKKHMRANIAGRTMIWTGLAIAFFLVYHLFHFTLRMTNPDISSSLDAAGRLDVYKMIVLSFKNLLISGAYIAALIALGLHIFHGIQSLVQTIGWNSDKTLPCVERYGRGIAFILFLGYVSIPVVIILGLLNYKG